MICITANNKFPRSIMICSIFIVEVLAVMRVFGRHLARDLCHGKQRVSPFYHVSQLLHEKNVFRSCGNGIHLARDLRHGKQRVSLFYHDLGLDLVGLIGNFWIVE